jgi:hypothetical protein
MQQLNNSMAEKKKSKKVNKLSLRECEDIIAKLGGQLQCQYVQKVLERQKELLVKKTFDNK